MTQSSENPTARYAAIDKRTAFKRNALVIVIAFLITSVLMEIIIRIFVGYEYPLIILYSELVCIGASLAFETFVFLRLSRRIFGDDFKDEQRFFKTSLAMFLSTYFLRCLILMLEILLWDIYVRWF